MPNKGGKRLRRHAQAVHAGLASLLVEQKRLAPDEVHQLRVAVKELRALWQVLKPVLPDSQADNASRGIKAAGTLLAAARDQYVHLKTLETLVPEVGTEYLSALSDARAQLKAQQRESAEDVLMTADIVSHFDRDRERWQALELSCSKQELILNGCGRLYRKAQKQFRKAAASGKAQDWHRLRRWVKYLALALPVVVDDGTADAEARQYANLAERLGDMHDLHVVAARLSALPDQDDASIRRAVASVEQRAKSLQSKCFKKSRRLFPASQSECI